MYSVTGGARNSATSSAVPPNNTVISRGNANATAKTTNVIVAIMIMSPLVAPGIPGVLGESQITASADVMAITK
jgi:hypothetical protein